MLILIEKPQNMYQNRNQRGESTSEFKTESRPETKVEKRFPFAISPLVSSGSW